MLVTLGFALSACGSSGDSTGGAPDDTGSIDDAAAVDSSGPTTDSATPIDGAKVDSTTPPLDTGSSPDTTTPVDTAPTCDKPAGGLPCDPKSIFCNGAGCDTTSHYCCAKSATAQSCVADGTKCADNSLHCDEAADCASGQICCFVAKSISAGDTVCATSCSGGAFSVQLCRTNGECGSGKCLVQTCSGAQIQACDKIPGCT